MYFSRYVSNLSKLVLKCITLFLFFLETSNSNSVCSLESLTCITHGLPPPSHILISYFLALYSLKKKKEHFKPIIKCIFQHISSISMLILVSCNKNLHSGFAFLLTKLQHLTVFLDSLWMVAILVFFYHWKYLHFFSLLNQRLPGF